MSKIPPPGSVAKKTGMTIISDSPFRKQPQQDLKNESNSSYKRPTISDLRDNNNKNQYKISSIEDIKNTSDEQIHKPSDAGDLKIGASGAKEAYRQTSVKDLTENNNEGHITPTAKDTSDNVTERKDDFDDVYGYVSPERERNVFTEPADDFGFDEDDFKFGPPENVSFDEESESMGGKLKKTSDVSPSTKTEKYTRNTDKPTVKEAKRSFIKPNSNNNEQRAHVIIQQPPEDFEESNNSHKISYTPYTVEDYKSIQQMDDANKERGSLGPSLDEEWERKRDMRAKIMQFAKKTADENKSNLPKKKIQKEVKKEPTKREIMKEYAKNLPKPTKNEKPKPIKTHSKHKEPEKAKYDIDAELIRHYHFQERVNDLVSQLSQYL